MRVIYNKYKFGSSYLVWIQNTDMYFQLEEPAWFVFDNLCNGVDAPDVVLNFSKQFNVELEDCEEFVIGIKSKIDELEKNLPAIDNIDIQYHEFEKIEFESFSEYSYLFKKSIVKFSYGDDWLEDYIHPLICHLEIKSESEERFLFELFCHSEKVILRVNGKVTGTWGRDESSFVKGKIFLELVNVLHEKSNDDWLMTVHASALTNCQKTILFSATPGSGKTTMAALLQAKGFDLISDDFVPLSRNTLEAYPFPIAMSVKEGSLELLLEYYPELAKVESVYISPEKTVRYLPIENSKMDLIYPVKEIIFVKYDPNADLELRKIQPEDAFKRLFEQIWVPPNTENVEVLFEKLAQLSFYQLNYSDSEKAVESVKMLFENE